MILEPTTKTDTFSFAGLELRCVTIEGQPWFVANDVLDHLGYPKGSRTYRLGLLDVAERGVSKIETPRGLQEAVVISESGLFKLALKAGAKNPKAREFQDWVTKVVLPAIRKDGMYVAGEEKLDLSKDADLTKMTLAVMEALQKKGMGRKTKWVPKRHPPAQPSYQQ